jgi:hypothetical protein
MKSFSAFLLITTFSIVFGGTYSGGGGTIGDPYRIANAMDLCEIGVTSADFDSYFVLVNDINMVGITTFVPIGYYATTSLTSGVPFTGYFDGQGFAISKLTITSNKPGIGVFGLVDSSDAVIKNVTVINPVFTTTSSSGRIGGLAGFCDANTISNCHIINPAITSGGQEAGGLIGTPWSRPVKISDCSVQGGTILGKNRVGGFAGAISSSKVTVFRCWASAQVSSNGTSASGSTEVGGFAGYINSTSGKITIVSECFATGNVTGSPYSDNVGGFTGSNRGTIRNCFARGDVAGRSKVGGFSGYHGHNGTPTTVENCYSTGKLTGTGSDIGGFTGYLFTYTAYCNNCYWDADTSEIAVSAEGLPLTTQQMFLQFNFTGWDFVSVWIMPRNDYPKLRFMYNPADLDASEWVNFVDFAIFANAWQSQSGDANYDLACDLQLPADGTVDANDLAVFVDNWLTE